MLSYRRAKDTLIWTVIHLFSKQEHFVPCKGLPSARRLAKLFVQHIYRLHGVPKRIISDRGPQFTARFWKLFLRQIGTDQGLSSAFHPSTNGAAERANAMVERYLRSYVSYQQDDWYDLLPFVESAYNNTVHSSTGYTPFRVVSGKDFPAIPELDIQTQTPHTPAGWTEKINRVWPHIKNALTKAAKGYKQQADKRRSDTPPFKVGEKVYLSTKYIKLRIPSKKLGLKYIGPFTITRVINPVTVSLRLPPLLSRIHPVFHSSLLKPAIGMRSPDTRLGPVAGNLYEVEKILDLKLYHGTLRYLVCSKGYPNTDATWVRVKDLNAP